MVRWLLVSGILLAGCGGNPNAEPTRSPVRDYPSSQTRTAADGEVLGADEQAPEDRLEQGPRIGPDGAHGAAEHPFSDENDEEEREKKPAPTAP